MKNSTRAFLAPFFCAIVFLAGCGSGGSDSAPAQQVSVEIHGDSILTGPGIATRPTQAMQALHPDWRIEDKSISGLALRSLVRGLQTAEHNIPPFAAVQLSGCYVVLEAGGNDALGLFELADFDADLRAAIAHVRASGRVPVLTGIVDLPVSDFVTPERKARRDEFNAHTMTLAREMGLQHAGWGEDYQGLQDVIDGIHRTQAASDRLAALLAGAVERAADAERCNSRA